MPRGIDLALPPPGDYLGDVIRETGDFFEAVILDHIAATWRGGIIVDAGAHIGNHAVFFAALLEPAPEVIAFEPVPANLALLRQNAEPWTITVHDVALGDAAGWVRINVDPNNSGHAWVDVDGPIRARMAMLDEYELDGVTLLKIDVEGWEPMVLDGAKDTIRRCRPRILIEDWPGTIGNLLHGYTLERAWREEHQTYLFMPAEW